MASVPVRALRLLGAGSAVEFSVVNPTDKGVPLSPREDQNRAKRVFAVAEHYMVVIEDAKFNAVAIVPA